ncbi:hypothetical protein SJI00_03980 [Pseudomonas sp. RP23018S]|uniref:hypothetical protein n=1 Tax=Pseudomonas sp. RP23018S TaxID=3096037 RepID=UPI002ACA7C34|nr:hypothetical protein [Pseudomonas sp. RP23018S]MDZ5601938.1 hypothetical protein [Pseudomonas sp. RP23018S]
MHDKTEIRREEKGISYAQHHVNLPRFIVIPAGIGFFHVMESATGRVRGFRRLHRDACLLAQSLDHSANRCP